jgi:outer membrane protein TolC
VEDSLIDSQKTAEQEKAKRQSVESLSKTLQLAKVRYLERISSYLDVAGAENQLLSARLSLVDVETQAFLATNNLYKALGAWGVVGKKHPQRFLKMPRQRDGKGNFFLRLGMGEPQRTSVKMHR